MGSLEMADTLGRILLLLAGITLVCSLEVSYDFEDDIPDISEEQTHDSEKVVEDYSSDEDEGVGLRSTHRRVPAMAPGTSPATGTASSTSTGRSGTPTVTSTPAITGKGPGQTTTTATTTARSAPASTPSPATTPTTVTPG